MAKMIKVVRVPVRIDDDDEQTRIIKYKALDKVMYEARFLGNMAIRYAIAFNLDEIRNLLDDDTEKAVPLDTRIYRILTKNRKYLDAGTVATLARNFAVKMYRNANKDAWAGRKSLPTYRSLFVPFRKQGTRIHEIEEKGLKQFMIEPAGFGGVWLPDELVCELAENTDAKLDKTQKKLKLVSCFSWKDTGAAEVVRRITTGEYQLSDSQIKRGDKGLTVYLSYGFAAKEPCLDPNKVCGVDLGVVIPAACAFNFGPQRAYLGNGDDVWAARAKFRAERRRKQRKAGLYSKTRRWERSEKEDKWIRTYYHAITRQVIKFCLLHDCGTIHVEDLTRLRQRDVKSEFKRLLWIPSKFNELLAYKAAEAGIAVVKINPRNTSRRCSECGHISDQNRKSQSEFICEKCGDPSRRVNADYNAAKNIALAEGDVIKNGYVLDAEENILGIPEEDLQEA